MWYLVAQALIGYAEHSILFERYPRRLFRFFHLEVPLYYFIE